MQIRSFLYLQVLVVLAALAMLGGCAHQFPQRPYVFAKSTKNCAGLDRQQVKTKEESSTPIDGKNYRMHVIEFDDQGWAYPDGGFSGPRDRVGNPSQQIDCALADVREQLGENGRNKILLYVYVHGWHHGAAENDRDVNSFKELLARRAREEPLRKVIGFYLSWDGETLDAPLLRELTFWGRKNAAHHVAEGRVREVFARIHGLRQHWNGPQSPASTGCATQATGKGDTCPIRTVMIGHSFGGLILFSAVEPYLLETLSGARDLPDSASSRTPRSQNIADLVILLNAAFEASRYEPIHRAAVAYHAADDEPPLVVSLTSTADLATKNLFPVARFINSILQYPSASDLESTAVRRTPGHIDNYLTHWLCVTSACGAKRVGSIQFCDLSLQDSLPPGRPRSIVWNVQTDRQVIKSHNDISNERVLNFFQYVYGQVSGIPWKGCVTSTQALPDVNKLSATDTTPKAAP